ncbi:hypothetical protein GCM10010413_21880 [Promicromonospora sukumoe]|uniref:DUF4232 domain-containing protein n=1 Tax=Promicromonospora sukumoe TaxID=88382 RepID=A0A7W3J9E1_9MICO|nr:DUF4232 domain-containing protein [Promicromonospora sukumoe]MBA8808594.1 hypothetical protein [Promicromonospora sukumoe]
MTKHRTIRTMCGAAGVAALLVTAGCSASSADGDTASGTPTASTTSAGPTESASSAPSGEASEPDSSESATDGTGSTDDSGATEGRCQTPELAGSLVPVEGGGGAGHYEIEVVLKNEAPQECWLQGWPGVSFVGDNDGTQLGEAATFDRSSPHDTVTLAPGESAQALVRVSNAENYGDECGQTPADGLRIYPPGEKRSLFVQNDQLQLMACADSDEPLLQVQALQPAS